MVGDLDYFRELETPRMARLDRNVFAAAYPMMKLMPARFILDQAEKSKMLTKKGSIIETTSGTFGMALALLAAARSYKLTLVTAATLIDPPFQRRLEMLGTNLEVLGDATGDGNQDGRLAYLRARLEDAPQTFWTQQYDNPGNGLSYARLADLLVRKVGQVDWLVGCIGTGGSLCGTGSFLRQVFPHLKIAAVDTHRSILFGQPKGRRMLRGLGNSVIPGNVKHELVDEVHWVGAYVAYRSAHRLLREHGLFVGPTSGASAIVAKWIGRLFPDATVAVILPDDGFRYVDTVYNSQWLSSLPDWAVLPSNDPETLAFAVPRSESEWTRMEWGRSSLN